MNIEQSSVAARARVHAALGDPARLSIVDTLMLGDASPGELAQALDMPTNLLAHHLNVLRDSGVLTSRRSEADRRRTYLRLAPEVLAGLLPPPVLAVPRVVFVCTRNSARSQLATALWARRSEVPTASAGTEPASRVHPRAVRVAKRHGLALDRARPVHVADVVNRADLVVAVCDNAHEHLPVRPKRRLHWSVPDPAASDSDHAFESAYTELSDRVDRLARVLTRQRRR